MKNLIKIKFYQGKIIELERRIHFAIRIRPTITYNKDGAYLIRYDLENDQYIDRFIHYQSIYR